MRNVLLGILKSYSHKAILQARSQLSLTQAQMADRLSMDTRSYVYLEHGETCCSALTVALFLIYCCPDPVKFLKELRTALQTTRKAAA